MGLSIPISTALDNILLAATALAWLVALAANPGRTLAPLRGRPAVVAAVTLFALLALGTLYGAASGAESQRVLGKYLDLLFLPIALTVFGDARMRRLGLIAFASGVGVDITLSYAAAAGMLQNFDLMPRRIETPFGFKAQITHGIMTALTAFTLTLWAVEARNRAVQLLIGGLALIALHNTLFIGIGRTGYLVVTALVLYFAATRLGGLRGIAVALLAASAALGGAYVASDRFAQRVDRAATELRAWQPGTGTTTSIGQRLEFYRNTAAIVAAHPLIGVGTGGFAGAYARQVAGTDMQPTANPHSDSLLIAVQIGLAGLAALLALYTALWIEAGRLPDPLARHLLRGLVLTIALGGMFNSLLLDHTEGLLFAWLAGLALAARPAPARPLA
jgi:O-antigen ligase